MMYLTITIKLSDSQFAYEPLQETTLTLHGDLKALSGMTYGISETASGGAQAMIQAEITRQNKLAAEAETEQADD